MKTSESLRWRLENMKAGAVRKAAGIFQTNSGDRYCAPTGGEDFAQVKKRTNEFLQEIYGKKEYQESHILITTHGAALAGLLNNIKGKSLAEYWGTGVHKNCGVTEVEVSGGIPALLSENVVYYDDEVEPWEEQAHKV